MQTYTSDTLYHMVGFRHPCDHERNFGTLCAILASMEVRPRQYDDSGKTLPDGAVQIIDYEKKTTNGELAVQTVVCFCDIPLEQLKRIHTPKYGCFGVGVDRSKFAEFGGRPVIYIPFTMRNPTCHWNEFDGDLKRTSQALRHFFRNKDTRRSQVRIGRDAPSSPEEAIDDALTLIDRELMAFVKFFDVDLSDDNPGNFYMEREWRKFARLPLDSMLRSVIVPEGYVERIIGRFPQHADKVVQISM